MGNGKDVIIGIDPIIGASNSHSLPVGFPEILEDLDITTLSKACNTLPGLHHYWYMGEDLCIVGDWKIAWDSCTRGLEFGGI